MIILAIVQASVLRYRNQILSNLQVIKIYIIH